MDSITNAPAWYTPDMQYKPIAFIRELLKDKSEEEILEAEENWREYMHVVLEIAQRLESEKEDKDADLDDLGEFL